MNDWSNLSRTASPPRQTTAATPARSPALTKSSTSRARGGQQPDLSYLPIHAAPLRHGSAQIVALVVIAALALPLLWSYCVR
jgi:hypothetical protein